MSVQREPSAIADRVPGRHRERTRAGARAGRSGGERWAGKTTALIVGGVVIGIVVLIIVLSSIGGGGSTPSAARRANNGSGTSVTAHRTHARGSSNGRTSHAGASSGAQASRPSEVNVAVLNGTETSGLAHHVSEELRQGGYERATALAGRPPGANSASVIEYARGHRADASEVARALGIAHVEAMEGTVASLAGAATVVVIVGLDKAAATP
jgi:LytR cell envelope-related transcriptional attenuator